MTPGSGTYFVYHTPHGPITIRTEADGVAEIAFGEAALAGELKPSDLSNRAANQLLEYFAGKRRAFDVPLALHGSDFQQSVWEAVARIPYGQTRTYADVADAIGHPGSHRAVGAAVRKNIIPLLIPDHRVVGANGVPRGSGAWARLRTPLLEAERARCAAERKAR